MLHTDSFLAKKASIQPRTDLPKLEQPTNPQPPHGSKKYLCPPHRHVHISGHETFASHLNLHQSINFHSFSCILISYQSIISFPFHFHSHFQCMPGLDPNQSITCNYQASAAERMSCKIDGGRTTPTPRNPSRKAKFFACQILNDSVPKDHVGRTRTDHKFFRHLVVSFRLVSRYISSSS